MTKEIFFPYGKENLSYKFDDKELLGVLTSSIEEYKPEFDEVTLVKKALEEPIGSVRLSELSRGKHNIVVIASDHTRPVPSKIIMPGVSQISCKWIFGLNKIQWVNTNVTA